MDECFILRKATEQDAVQISDLVKHTLRVSNARDYPPSVIDRIAESFSPDAILEILRTRTVLVACRESTIIGTASFSDDMLRTVFVSPKQQGMGIGRQLVSAIEAHASQKGKLKIKVQSSLTAVPFYACLGYRRVKDAVYGEEITVIMEKQLSET